MREGTRHLWAAGAGILVVGYASKIVVWEMVWSNVSEKLAVEQKKNVADYQSSREGSKAYSIPKEYFEGIDWKKTRLDPLEKEAGASQNLGVSRR